MRVWSVQSSDTLLSSHMYWRVFTGAHSHFTVHISTRGPLLQATGPSEDRWPSWTTVSFNGATGGSCGPLQPLGPHPALVYAAAEAEDQGPLRGHSGAAQGPLRAQYKSMLVLELHSSASGNIAVVLSDAQTSGRTLQHLSPGNHGNARCHWIYFPELQLRWMRSK